MTDFRGESIDKLMMWRAGTWVKYESKASNMYLKIYGDQLLLTTDVKILETINMQCKIKGIYKEDILILIISNGSQNVRKIKFQVKNPVLCFQTLGQYFPVVRHNSTKSENEIVRYRNANDVLKAALESGAHLKQAPEVPADFKNFMKLCLLDPTFPNFVQASKNVLEADALM